MSGRAAGAMLAAGLALAPHVATAQTSPQISPPALATIERMTVAELQGVSCIVAGVLTAAGALAFGGALATAALDVSFPVLALPILAGGYAIGCNVGATTGPGAYWLYGQLAGR